MFKKVISVAMLLACVFTTYAQQWPTIEQLTPLPLNDKVKSGVLPNGLSYYILHNEEPKDRANFYIAQKVGSTLETPEQLGLAHFLEHMAFNGTTHFPGKTMLEYLQSKGIRFGADINAYTSFDETVYNINNVPTNDKELIDNVLMVLHDWSGDILLETEEIDAERGVIESEWRSRNNAQFRMFSSLLPKIYEEYQYQQMPIGKMEIVKTFDPEVLRAYYKKWYRPDLQGIIIVGDFDANEMERKVKELFSTIEMPKNAAKRTYPKVSDNKKPIFASFSDPELTDLNTTISFKSEKVPFEIRNTVEMYYMTDIVETVLTTLFNNRLSEFSLSPECDYVSAGVFFDDYYISKTKDSFNIDVTAKKNTNDAVADAMAIVARAAKTGFTESEFDRAKEQIMANIEKQYNERDKRTNEAYGRELCRFFIDNEPAPGIETEYGLWQMILSQTPLEVFNGLASEVLTPDNMVVVTAAPQADGFELVGEQVLIKTITDAMNAKYEPYVDEVITEPLISNLPKPGSITNIEEDKVLGTTVYTLSNGVKVVLKPTDFAADEVIMTAYRDGGKQIYNGNQAANVAFMDNAFAASKWGPFDNKTLKKYMSGKKASLSFTVDNYTDELSGQSTVKDLPTLFELIYTVFTNLNPDPETFQVSLDKVRPMLENMQKDPQMIFAIKVNETQYPNNPLMAVPTVATLEAVDYPETLGMVKDVLKNAAEYTFIFTGNIDKATIRPLLEQYIATLPVGLRKKVKVETPIEMAKGQIDNTFKQPMQVQATEVFDVFSDALPFTVKNDIMVDMMGAILRIIFTNTLREEEGGTYSPYVGAVYQPHEGRWNLVYSFNTNAEMQAKMVKRAYDEYMNLLKNGTNETDFNKVKEAMIAQFEINSKKNNYWNSLLELQYRYPNVPIIKDYQEELKNVTLDEFNKFLKTVYSGKDRIQVIMEGVAAN